MKMEELRFRITGVTPLLLNNGQMADPLNPMAKKLKAVTSKRNKTDADYEAMARLEWYGSLYVVNDRIVIPGANLEAMLLEAGRKFRKGKLVQAGVFCQEESPIIYDGPADIDELWTADQNRFTVGVKIRGSRVMRTRPMFREWSLEFTVNFDSQLLDEGEIEQIVVRAGENIGLGDWRPKFGRFTAQRI